MYVFVSIGRYRKTKIIFYALKFYTHLSAYGKKKNMCLGDFRFFLYSLYIFTLKRFYFCSDILGKTEKGTKLSLLMRIDWWVDWRNNRSILYVIHLKMFNHSKHKIWGLFFFFLTDKIGALLGSDV